MKREVLSTKVHPNIKAELKRIADLKQITPSELNERVLKTYINLQKEKGVI